MQCNSTKSIPDLKKVCELNPYCDNTSHFPFPTKIVNQNLQKQGLCLVSLRVKCSKWSSVQMLQNACQGLMFFRISSEST